MLASDLANTEFTGSVSNPDDLLYVQFYWNEPIDKWESEKIGKPVKMTKRVPVTDDKGVVTYKDTGETLRIPFVRFMRPGDKETIMEVAVDESHKRRWPQKWMAWQMQEGMIDGEGTVPGWPIQEWGELTAEQIHELKYLRFSTVEQVAGASDAQVQRMGMGGLSLREKAKVAMRNRMGKEVQDALALKDAELLAMKERMAALEAAVLGKNAAPQSPTPAGEGSAVAGQAPVGAAPDERAGLAEQYKAKFGRAPHHKMSISTLKDKLA